MQALRNFDWPEALLFDCDGVSLLGEQELQRLQECSASLGHCSAHNRPALYSFLTPPAMPLFPPRCWWIPRRRGTVLPSTRLSSSRVGCWLAALLASIPSSMHLCTCTRNRRRKAEGCLPCPCPCPPNTGLDHEWSLDQYGELLEVGGGKERMDAYFSSCAGREPWASITGEGTALGAV